MLNNPNTLLSKAEWCRYCIHLTTLNLYHFTVVEAMGLKAVASISPAMASPPYTISSKSINRFKSCWVGRDTQTGTDTYIWTDR
jgi:hypothetical protein